MTRSNIIAIAIFVIAVIVFGVFLLSGTDLIRGNWVGGHKLGKVYPLAFTQQYTTADGNRGQTFVTPDTCGFSVPLTGPRGEKNIFTAAEAGEDIPENSFKVVRKTSPELTVGAAQFQPSYDYVIVVYNAKLGHQDFVPVFAPNNRCSE